MDEFPRTRTQFGQGSQEEEIEVTQEGDRHSRARRCSKLGCPTNDKSIFELLEHRVLKRIPIVSSVLSRRASIPYLNDWVYNQHKCWSDPSPESGWTARFQNMLDGSDRSKLLGYWSGRFRR